MSKTIMAMALSVALIFGMTPVPVFAEDAGGTLTGVDYGDHEQTDIYYTEDPIAQTHDLIPGESRRGGSLPDLQSETLISVFSQPSNTNSPLFAENRVIVKLVNSGSNMSTAAADMLQSRSLPLNLGVSFTDIRLLNPSMESSNTGGFTTDSVQAPTPSLTFNSQLSTFNSNKGSQDNVFVLTLEETGIDAVENALAALNANPAVEIAEPDFLYELLTTPNDPMYNMQYALERINAERAWDITTGSKSVVVGVVDTGIDSAHPDLADNLWVNPDPNQNGYVNDIHGYNFAGRVGGVPTDTHGHGTHVAGIIGAKGNNGTGLSGVNWDVSLAWLGVAANGFVSTSAAIEAINYAHNHNISILNNSWGGRIYSETLKKAIANYNGLFVAAAGNDKSNNDTLPHYPSGYDLPNVISVASTDASDKLSSSSNYGDRSVHIAAPGNVILSTWKNGAYEEKSGTSMASPHVAGVAALVKAVNPGFSPEAIKEILIETARRPDTLAPYKFGIVDANAAIRYGINFSTFIYGDVNGDGFVDLADLMALSRWLANWSYVVINEAAADVDLDNDVTIRDLVVLRRHFANWAGYENLPLQSQQQVSPVMTLMNAALFGDLSAVPAINVSSASGTVGDIVDVNIGLSDNPGIIAMRLGVEFDDSVLRLVEVIDNGILGKEYHRNGYAASPHTLFWENGASTANFNYSGDIATLRFKILSETADSPITVSYDRAKLDVLDVDLNPVHFEMNNGSVSTSAADFALVGAVPSASVKKLNGNKNELTVAVTETYSDGSTNKITKTFSINNNSAGSYHVGSYVVYVDTKGNDQIRQCYIE